MVSIQPVHFKMERDNIMIFKNDGFLSDLLETSIS